MAVWQNNGVLQTQTGGIQYTHARQPQPTQAPKTGPNTTLRPHDRELDTRGARSRTGGGRARKRRGGRAVRGPITTDPCEKSRHHRCVENRMGEYM